VTIAGELLALSLHVPTIGHRVRPLAIADAFEAVGLSASAVPPIKREVEAEARRIVSFLGDGVA
jgi:hypothetical protein